ncbi:CarboxypepD_reg-like domain-containing protein [Aquimarina spongiae]|uniref:CarboxypepD_reg-like domain-containing protein n=1 Tax=Aquimarina spongiae TaxID=570521 RepID=A0A1M6L7Y0_9FLAO|nr:CarboxypepD_reg-like domain-containing protein [Aquimarina spongiae]
MIDKIKIQEVEKYISMVLLIFPLLVFGQAEVLKGVVLDKATKAPLEGVVIYIDGTTTGTVTNASGAFILDLENQPRDAQVTIAYLGYESIYLKTSSVLPDDVLSVQMEKKLEELDPVFLQNDDWSREKKLNYFRAYFIGNKKDQKTCKILNEDAIRLYYNYGEQTLYASANVPINIKNDQLGYNIVYNLVSFEIKFNRGENVKGFYVAGTSYFKAFDEESKALNKRRQNAYKGSRLHFMRSLATGTLDQNKFDVYHKGLKTEVDRVFKVEKEPGFAKVYPLQKRTTVLFKNKHRTDLIFNVNDHFLIDGLGNFSDTEKILFNGEMTNQKVARLLPLDYGL